MGLDGFFDYPGTEAAIEPTRETPFLATCTDEEWAVIRAHTDTVRYDAGAVVISGGSVERTLMLLVRGQLEVVVPAKGRKVQRVGVLAPGSVVGELGFLDGEPASATVRALDEVEVLRLPLQRFEILAAKDPQLGLYVLFDLARLVSLRLRTANDAMHGPGRAG